MNARDLMVRKHESAHASAAILLGREVLAVKVYGQHGIASGHGVTETRPTPGADPTDSLVIILAGLIYEPMSGDGDARAIAELRSMGADIDTASDRAHKLVATPAFRALALAVDEALYQKSTLTAEDVRELLADAHLP